MKPLFADSRPLDERARQEYGLTTETMMEHAAMALEAAVRRVGGRVLIVCGSGDNGGDGYALARRLLSEAEYAAGSLSEAVLADKASSAFKACAPESVVVLAARPPKSAACIAQAERAEKAGVRIITDLSALKAAAAESGLSRECVSTDFAVVVDCLFGSGFHGAPDDATAALIEKLNALDAWKIACDIPSCLPFLAASADKAAAPVFRADETITMGALKSVLFEDFAKDWTGAVTCAPLGVSRNQFEAPSASGPAPEAHLLEESDLVLPHRTKQNSNKGTYGHAAIVVGDKCGAGIIAGTAALTYGAGLVTLVTDRDLAAPEFLRQAQPADKYAEGVCMLMQSPSLPENTTAAALGMGLGRDEEAIARGQKFLDELMKRPEAGVVIDADMCYHPGIPAFLKARAPGLESVQGPASADAAEKSGAGCESAPRFRTVITPHPKEFSALLELCGLGSFSVKDIQSRRLEFARLFASAYPGVVLILKGANPVIACASSSSACDVLVNPLGMPCLAKAGSGDVLAGLTAALLAQGRPALESAKQASLAHTCASRRIRNDFAMTPFSLIEEIAQL